MMPKTIKEHVADLEARGVRCNCDPRQGEPEPKTGHSRVCRIHKYALDALKMARNK